MNQDLRTLFLANAIFVLANALLIPVFALLITGSGGGAELSGFLFSISFLISAVAGILIIRIKDKRFLNLKMLQINYLVRALAWLSLAFFSSIPMIVAAQVIIGITTAAGGPAFNSIVSEHLDGSKHIQEWGYWELIANPAVALGSALSGIIVVKFGFSSLFFIMSFLGFVSFLILLKYQRQHAKEIR